MGCEFLSIWYFYRSSFNWMIFLSPFNVVVNSFQFGIFTEVLSTRLIVIRYITQLWIPFNLVFLPKFFQLLSFKELAPICCEFLSIWYFYRSSFNLKTIKMLRIIVVNSFQFGIFTEVLSTKMLVWSIKLLLWIPFNLVFLPKFFQRILLLII